MASLATSGSMQMFQQPQLLAAFATMLMANNPLAAAPPAVPSPFAAAAGMADGAQTLQTLAQMQNLFGMANPAAAQMMSMQQVCPFYSLSP